MGTHPIFESDFDCLTEIIQKMWPDEYEYAKANNSKFQLDSDAFVIEFKLTHTWGKELVYQYGHRHVLTQPNEHFYLLEPGGEGGCDRKQWATIAETAQAYGKSCLVSVNGGFFNMKTGECLGNLITSNSAPIRNSGLRIPSLGLTQHGEFFIGYMGSDLIEIGAFEQLISGVVWLVRQGANNVQNALDNEDDKVQDSFDLVDFAHVQSARTAIGIDSAGRLVLVEVDGKTGQRGLDLFDFADFLVQHFDLVNAINLDGGGSASVNRNNVVVNYPSDFCRQDEEWRCARRVSSMICIAEKECDSCVHGTCRDGECICESNWTGAECSTTYCKGGCIYGKCREGGVCQCEPGWSGDDCSIPCDMYHFGVDCAKSCDCWNKRACNSVTGECICPLGVFTASLTCEPVVQSNQYSHLSIPALDCGFVLVALSLFCNLLFIVKNFFN